MECQIPIAVNVVKDTKSVSLSRAIMNYVDRTTFQMHVQVLRQAKACFKRKKS